MISVEICFGVDEKVLELQHFFSVDQLEVLLPLPLLPMEPDLRKEDKKFVLRRKIPFVLTLYSIANTNAI